MFTAVRFFLVVFGLHSLVAALPANKFTSKHATSHHITPYLDAHNQVRALHGADDLVWNSTLAEKAQEWASLCSFQHSDGLLLDTPYGENIVAATGEFSIAAAVQTFTEDRSSYNPITPSYLHWTQVVWKSTTQLGCALAQCDDIFDHSLGKASYYVCLYDPAGNVVGEALANVQV